MALAQRPLYENLLRMRWDIRMTQEPDANVLQIVCKPTEKIDDFKGSPSRVHGTMNATFVTQIEDLLTKETNDLQKGLHSTDWTSQAYAQGSRV